MKKTIMTAGAVIAGAAALLLLSNTPNSSAGRVLVNYHDGTAGPVGWPSGVQATDSDEKQGWADNLTVEEYESLRASKQANYDAWKATRDAPARAKEANDAANRRNTASIQAAIASDNVADYINGLTPAQFTALNREIAIQWLLDRR